ncbi:ATP-binding protein [Jannaschia sp. R86511]|uniref:ATP-binding protein n=1 Tax=Jannaschia sp. R86511 TaxID=3093853 RepID=UPI0036D3B3E9
MTTGRLRVYLGAAPGVGKTYTMLEEGRRRAARGTQVVVGVVETHDRPRTAAVLEGLPVVPRRVLEHRGARLTEMDTEALLDLHPEVVLVDELAHTNAPGSAWTKRWQDVQALLAAGIDVVTTVNIQHLESLNDVVTAITGIRQQETVPDSVVRAADQIELVDMSPHALRRRLAHGNVYAADKVDAALTNYFRVGNLTALRELALLWTADRVDDALARYRADNDIEALWPARDRVVVALSGGPEGEALVRRAARTAGRGAGGELMALHVARSDGLRAVAPAALLRQRSLVESLGGSWHLVVGDDVPAAVLDFARGVNASLVVLGESRRGRVAATLAPGIGPAVIRGSGELDVQVVTHDRASGRVVRRRRRRLFGTRRLALAWTVSVLGSLGLAAGLFVLREDVSLTTALLLSLGLSVGVALLGGWWPALLSALTGGLATNFTFTEPRYTLAMNEAQEVVSLGVVVAVTLTVCRVVDVAAARSVEAARARSEAAALTSVARSVLQGEEAVPRLLEQLLEALSLAGAELVREPDAADDDQGAPSAAGVLATAGRTDAAPVTEVPTDAGLRLRLHGRELAAHEVGVAAAVAAQAAVVVERDRLRAQSRRTRAERERTAIRTAMLAAVSHDLRTPLAGIKASVGGLLTPDVELAAADREELLRGVDDAADRLQSLVDNLLDMSRLDAGAVHPRPAVVSLDEIVPRALGGVPEDRVHLRVPEALPLVLVDPGLVERSLANVVENAVRHSPADARVLVCAEHSGGEIVLRVVDHGPGVPDDLKAEVFQAFQRLGDRPAGDGVGLGLAVARGFVEASGGSIEAEDTPGGGLTMVLRLPLAPTGDVVFVGVDAVPGPT